MSDPIDGFVALGLPRRAALDPEAVREAFQTASKSAHPDAGGDAAEFERLTRAHGMISDPVRRLRHLAELEFGAPPERGGAIGAETMSQFDLVAAALSAADDLLKRRGGASTAIARALLAKPEAEASAAVLAASGALRARKAEVVATFAAIDEARCSGEREAARIAIGRCANELAFLLKWEAQLGERMAALLADG